VKHAPGIADGIKPEHFTPKRHGGGNLARKPVGIDRHLRVRFQHAHSNPGMPVIKPAPDPRAINANDIDQRAGLGARLRFFD